MLTLLILALLPQAAVVEVKDQKYYDGPDADERKHKLDLYLPKTEGKSPVIVWIHGGAWKSGDRSIYGGLGRRFAQEGVGLAAISYRLSPAVKHPEHVKDCARAFGWTHANVAKHGGDPERLFVMGQSAGGHLSALLALDPKHLEAEKVPKGAVKGAIPMSGVYFIPALPADAKGALRMLPDAFGSDPAACRDASPVTHVGNCDFPMLVCTETDDNFRVRPSMELLKGAVSKEGVRNVEFFDAQDRNHISIVVRMGAPGEDPTRQRILEFVRARCKELDSK
jgi:acetyl esterase/lipase